MKLSMLVDPFTERNLQLAAQVGVYHARYVRGSAACLPPAICVESRTRHDGYCLAGGCHLGQKIRLARDAMWMQIAASAFSA
jgi:hypothetical protein